MRVLAVLWWLALGVALAGGLQWAEAGGPGLPAATPAWVAALLPAAGFLAFGAYLAAVFGAGPRPALGALGALAGLALAAVPLAYTFGLAQRYGLPSDGGAIGGWLAGPYARGAGAVWLPVAVAAAVRPRGRRAGAPAGTEPQAYWAAPQGAELPVAPPESIAFAPSDAERP